jgi:outer membrane protein assembly factor BamD
MIKKILKSRILVFPFLFVLFISCAKDTPQRKKDDDSFEGLRSQAEGYLDKNKKPLAVQSLEKMMEMYPENSEISKHRLSLADLYFAKKEYASAYNCYRNFYKKNPSDPKADYASYRSVLCKFYQTFGIKRDPTNIKKTIKRCEKHLAENNFLDTKYDREIKDIKYTCNKMLVDREIYIFNFYLRKKKYKSAKNRLKYIREEFSSKYPHMEPQILYLESKLAKIQKQDDVVKQNAQILAKNYPDSHFGDMTKHLLEKRKLGFWL